LGKEAKDLPLPFRLFEGFDAEHNSGRTSALGDNHGISGAPNLVERSRRVLAKVGDRDHVRYLGHIAPPC
jgi:hypothetical protein